jgi:hypothetical protein
VRDDVGDVAIGEFGIEIETEMGQLECDIGLHALRGDAVEVGFVFVDDQSRSGLVLHSFTEKRGIGAQTALIERA